MRFSKALPLALAALTLGITACTGSSEGSRIDPRLVVAGTLALDTAPPTCPGGTSAAPTTAGPGLLLLSTAALDATLTGGQDARCARLATEPLPSPAFELKSSPDGTRVYATLPQSGEWRVYDATLKPIGTPVGTPAGASAFCPTRLAVSADGTTIAVLDDPTVTGSGCQNTNRAPTVRIYNAGDLSLRATLEQPVSLPVVPFNRSFSPLDIAISTSDLYVLAPTVANTYQLYRYDLNATNLGAAVGTGIFTTGSNALNLNPTATPVQALDLQRGPDNLILTYYASGVANLGNTVTINTSSGAVTTLSIGTPSTPVGGGTRVHYDSTTASIVVVQPARSLVIAPDNTTTNGPSATDATIAPDGFAYLTGQGASTITRMDVTILARGGTTQARSVSIAGTSSTTAITTVLSQ